MTDQGQGDDPRVVIIGGGFGGLKAARALRGAPARVTLIDRTNHHLFQPLLYQVATAGLSPADVAAPIRHILRGRQNLEVVLGEARAVDLAGRRVELEGGSVGYDYLVLAAGARTSYFGNDAWEALAPGLKTAEDALTIREQFLLAFEDAEQEPDEAARRALLSFVVVGGGPTGVEMAGTMAELARRAFQKDFRRIDTSSARVALIEAGPRLLAGLPERLSARAKRDLERLGVEVRLDSMVTGIDAGGVRIGEERIEARQVVWAAGIEGVPLIETLGVELTRDKRVRVEPDCSIPGHPEVFALGDLALHVDQETGGEAPGVAPAAAQMGRFIGRLIADRVSGRPRAGARFRYIDKGTMATIGRARAVANIRGVKVAGLPAWLLWLGVHIFFLIGFRNRVVVLIQWAWAYATYQRGARLITRPFRRRQTGGG